MERCCSGWETIFQIIPNGTAVALIRWGRVPSGPQQASTSVRVLVPVLVVVCAIVDGVKVARIDTHSQLYSPRKSCDSCPLPARFALCSCATVVRLPLMLLLLLPLLERLRC